MIRGLFGRLLAVMCGVAAASTGLVLVLQERNLSADLERAAEQRLDNAAVAAERLLEGHLTAMAERYRAVSGTPQFRATLEIDHAPTLAHYAETLLQQHDAARIAFVRPDGRVAAAAGESALDAAALPVESNGLVAHDGRPYAVVSTRLSRAGRLLAVEPLEADTLAVWSELCGAEVSFGTPGGPTTAELQRTVLRLDGLELRVASSLQAERAAMHNARLHLGLAAALGLALAFGVSWVVSRGLVRPIQEVQLAAHRIGEGDLTRRLDATDRADEIGDVVRAFEEMTHELAGTIRQVAAAADRVEATAGTIAQGTGRFLAVTQEQQRGNDEAATTLAEIEQLIDRIAKSAGESAHSLDLSVDGSTASFRELAESGEALRENASELSDRSDEIIRSLEQVIERSVRVADDAEGLLPATETATSSATEVASAARTVSKNAEETARLSSGVVETAERGRQIVRDAVQGMEATRETIEESERVIQALNQRAAEIGTILTVIDDVSDETNLLALNAAIIAAQAGERGKAFAVVADEMKAVCERVQAGTREIEAVVRAVQQETANAASSISRGTARAREGATLIRQAEASLAEITSAARESGDHMTESASSTAQQMVAAATMVEHLETLRTGVERIRAVTRAQVDANATVQRSSNALCNVAERMRHAVDLQTGGTSRIGQSVEDVQRTVREITQGLAQQGAASREVASVVRRSMELTRSHEASAAEMASAVGDLERQAEALRDAVRRFRV